MGGNFSLPPASAEDNSDRPSGPRYATEIGPLGLYQLDLKEKKPYPYQKPLTEHDTL